jgi:sugar phosphate isomerase/epimerase
VDYVEFLRRHADRIYHVHMKDVYWSPRPANSGIFGGHLPFGDPRRCWEFRSLGRGSIRFEPIMRALNDLGYRGPLSVEWEDSGMDREHGATEACRFVRKLDFPTSARAFDAAFDKKEQGAR